jgi:hypothetical protein
MAFIFGLLCLGMNTIPTEVRAQSDNFPIGLFIQYRVSFDANIGLDYEYIVNHEISEWIDYERLIVRYGRNNSWRNEYLTDLRSGGPDYPRMWMDVSTWQLQDYFLFNGMMYEFTTIENLSVPQLGDIECFRLNKETENDGIQSTGSIWYHGELGILVDFIHVSENLEDSPWVETYNQTMLVSNLDEFNPPTFTDPDSPEITTTIPSTTITSTSSYNPAIPETIPLTPEEALIIILAVGIVIELPLLLYAIRKWK